MPMPGLLANPRGKRHNDCASILQHFLCHRSQRRGDRWRDAAQKSTRKAGAAGACAAAARAARRTTAGLPTGPGGKGCLCHGGGIGGNGVSGKRAGVGGSFHHVAQQEQAAPAAVAYLPVAGTQ